MTIKPLSDKVAVSPQIPTSIMEQLKSDGYSTLICNRPDGEEPGQPPFEDIRAAAEAAGLTIHNIPISPGHATAEHVEAFGKAIDDASGKVLAYCRSGARSQSLFEASRR